MTILSTPPAVISRSGPRRAHHAVLPIAIVIDGERLPVNPPPVFVQNHLLVPVRRTLSALGLSFLKSGRTVTTYAGADTIALTIGSRIAHVDGRAVLLDAAPVEIHQTLYAPLRFFTDAIGSQARYVRQTNSIDIVSTLIGRSGNGMLDDGGGVEELGTITAVDLDSEPATVTVTYNASVRTVPIEDDAAVVVQDVIAGTSNAGNLSDIHPGDFAQLFLNRSGQAKRVVDAFGSRSGRVAAAADGKIVLTDGHVIAPGRQTAITLNGESVGIDALHIGDSVMIRYNIDSSEPLAITATRAATGPTQPAAGLSVRAIHLDPSTPLRAGETLNVTVDATPNGTGSFDIGPYVQNRALQQTTPGHYTGAYTVKPGENFSGAPVIVHLNVNGTALPAVTSAQTVSVSTQAPGFGELAPADGAQVDSLRPAIYATFVAGAVPVDASSARIVVNGHDVTSESVRTSRFIEYRPEIDYPPGLMHVVVEVADDAGNTATKRWTLIIGR